MSFINTYRKNGSYSQNGEEGVINEILKRIKLKKGTAVEFGGGDGYFCSNTAHLRSKGWNVVMYDHVANDLVEAKTIHPSNVNELPECDVLSIDVDGNDYNIWKAYTGRPKVVVIEINSDILPTERVMNKGTSYLPMVELGLSKDYFVVGHTGNVVFCLNEYKDLFPEITADPLKEVQEYFNYSWIK